MNKYALSFKSAPELLKYVEEQSVRFIDFNFTDINGKWRHISRHADAFDKAIIENGISFNGAAFEGWNEPHRSDMILKPDIRRVTYDPFAAQKTLKIFCDVFEPGATIAFNCDPRSVAKAAEKYLKKTSICDVAYFGPEPEFFIFDNVTSHVDDHHVAHKLDSEENPANKGRDYPTGNMAHRPKPQEGYGSEGPVDSLSDIRAEMLSVIESMGVAVEKHHHEIAPGQCELGIKYASLLDAADNVQLYKHAVHNVAHTYGKTATFMPKPLNNQNGSGMHINQSLWKSGKPLFSGTSYSNLSDTALYYIGGILKHARALNAFTNPATNSYKRLMPAYNAPVTLAYSAHNRTAACRIPYSNAPENRRVEARFPDSMANPYLAFSALLMAGLDGVENKIHPGDALETDFHTIAQQQDSPIPKLGSSLEEALEALRQDHDFLLKGDVFTLGLIDAFITLKSQEIETIKRVIHPAEIDMYYSS